MGWAWAFNTPFKLWKRFGNYRGGTADPDADTGKTTQFFSMLGTRAIWHEGWKAATAVPASPNYWGSFDDQRWELFDTTRDPSECHDLAEQQPDKLKELIALWWVEAEYYQALPLETRNAVEAFTTPRPQLSKPRDRYVYFPGGAPVPESVAPNTRGRSYTLAVELDVDTPDAGGVLFEQGSRFGGHALYVKDRKLHYVYNVVGELVQTIVSDEPLPTGPVVVSASFTKDQDTMPAEGTLTLQIRDKQVGEGNIRTQPGKFDLSGAGFLSGARAVNPSLTTTPASHPHPSPEVRSNGCSSMSAENRLLTSPARRPPPTPASDSRAIAGGR